jgi:long-chain acyl-CoA synthetase
MLVHEFLEASADLRPDKVALICGPRRLTYAQLDRSANRLAHALLDNGVRRDDRVAVFLEPSVEAVVSVFGALKAGATFVVINPLVKPKKLAYILGDCGAAALVANSATHPREARAAGACSSIRRFIDVNPDSKEHGSGATGRRLAYRDIMKRQADSRPASGSIDIDLASLIYTSGSTGFPKGVMMTHLNMDAASRSIIQYLENTPDDIILNVLPLSFDYGLYQVLMAFRFGGTLIQERSFLYPYQALRIIKQEGVTGFPIVPSMAVSLLSLRNIESYKLPSLRYFTSTAQAFPAGLIRRLRQLFPRVCIFSMYGLTECKRVSYLPPEEIDRRPGSVGKAMPNTEAYIIDRRGQKVEKAGEVGELVVRGAHIMKGYWNIPEETRRVLKPGPVPGEKVLHTGDLFQMDKDGFLYFVSRKDEMIKVSGALVSPREVENVLSGIPGVREAAVVGVGDPLTGEAVKAVVVLEGGATLGEEDIRRHCGRVLENYMVPKVVEFWTKIPKSAHGKVLKRALRQPAEGGRRRRTERVQRRAENGRRLEKNGAQVPAKGRSKS